MSSRRTAGRPSSPVGGAWLLALGVVLGAIAAFFFLAFVFLGIALTIGAVVLVVLPVMIGIALIGSLVSRRP